GRAVRGAVLPRRGPGLRCPPTPGELVMAMRPDRTIATFQGQRPEWSADGDGVEHATITVPLDYTGGDGDRLSIALSRLRARDPSARRGVLLALNGGPGGYYGL